MVNALALSLTCPKKEPAPARTHHLKKRTRSRSHSPFEKNNALPLALASKRAALFSALFSIYIEFWNTEMIDYS